MVVSGHCLCGFVVYEYSGVVGPAGYCHCADCRRWSGSAFGVSVRFDTAALRIVHGHVKGFRKQADSGVELTRSFCPECGSALFTASARNPQYTFVQAGSLDDPTLVQPTQQSWVCSAVPWRIIDESMPAYERGKVP